MKVGVYAPPLDARVGGGHTYVSEVLRALAAAAPTLRHEIVAVGRDPDPPADWSLQAYVSTDGPLYARILGRVRRHASEVAPALRAPSRVDTILIEAGIDLMWCPVPGTPTHWLPFVTTVWDLQHRLQPIFPEVSRGVEWDERERFYRSELGQASIVIVGTEAGKAEVMQFYGVPASRIRCLPHPTPTFALRPHADPATVLRKYGLDPGYILYPAQFWAHKNHVLLLEAARRLLAIGDDSPLLVFVGSDHGNETHIRRLAAEMGLTPHLRVLGFVPREDLTALYQEALLMAYPSYFGPENLPPLEAFALGCPVIAADVAGAAEQLGDAALLVSPGDADGLADLITTVRRDAELRGSLIQRGRERARTRTSDHYVRGMMAVVDELEPSIRTWR